MAAVDLDEIVSCTALMSSLKGRYPTISQVLERDSAAAIGWLHNKKAVCSKQANLRINIDEVGDDNIKTWRTYYLAIKDYLDTINSDDWLEEARGDVARFLHARHYDKFPRWPAVGEKQSSHIPISMGNRAYDLCGKSVLVWVGGSATITDDRPQQREYRASFEGQPTMRAIAFHHAKMRELENVVSEGGSEAALNKIREKNYAPLTWEEAF